MLKLGTRSLVSTSVRHAGKEARLSYIALSTFFRDQQDLSRQQNVQNRRISVASHVKTSYASGLGSLNGEIRSFSSSPRFKTVSADSKKVDSAGVQDQQSVEGVASKGTAPSSADAHHEGRKREVLAHVSKYPKSLQALAMSLPSSGFHRPTKDE
jgi:hypothetical protein